MHSKLKLLHISAARSWTLRGVCLVPLCVSFLVSSLLISGCKDAAQVVAANQSVSVVSFVTSVCYDNETLVGTAGVIAVAFDGIDGSVAPGTELTFSVDRGSIDPATVTTSARGEAGATVTAPHEVGDPPVTVTVLHPNGETAEVVIPWPRSPLVFLSSSLATPTVGQKFLINTSIFSVCNVKRFSFTLSYDSDKLRYDEPIPPDDDPDSQKGGLLEIPVGDPPDPDMTLETTTLDITDDGAGTLTVDYFQNVVDPPGTNREGIFLSLPFEALAEGNAEIAIPSQSTTGSNDLEYVSTDVTPITVSVQPDPGP